MLALTEDVHLLVIHVDADIAEDVEIGVAQPCPPPMATVESLRDVLMQWLQVEDMPPKVAFWIPSIATEAWILRAFFPDDPLANPCVPDHPGPCVECLKDPARALIHRQPKFVRMRAGVVKKRRPTYRQEAETFTQRWRNVVETCAPATWLDDQLTSITRVGLW